MAATKPYVQQPINAPPGQSYGSGYSPTGGGPDLGYDPADPSTWGAGLPYGYGAGQDPSGIDPTDFSQFDPYGPGAASTDVTYGGGYLTTTKTLTDDLGNRWDLGSDGTYHSKTAQYSMPAVGGSAQTRQYLPQNASQNGPGGPGMDGGGYGQPGFDTQNPYAAPNQDISGLPNGWTGNDGQQYGSTSEAGGTMFDSQGNQWPYGYGPAGAEPGAVTQQGSDFLFDPYTGEPLGSQQAAGGQAGPQRYLPPNQETVAPTGGGGATTLSPDEIRAVAQRAGFTGAGLDRITQIAMAESTGDFGQNTVNQGGDLPGSTDRGLLQINNQSHAEVSDADAADPYTAMQAAYRISKGGTDFHEWTTNSNGRADAQPTGGGGVRPDIQKVIESIPADVQPAAPAPAVPADVGGTTEQPGLPAGLSAAAKAMGDFQNPETAARMAGVGGSFNAGTQTQHNYPGAVATGLGLGLVARKLGQRTPEGVAAGYANSNAADKAFQQYMARQSQFRPDTRVRADIPRVPGMRTDEIRASMPAPWLAANRNQRPGVFTPPPSRASSPYLSGIGNVIRYQPPPFRADIRTRTPVPFVPGMRTDEMRQAAPAQWQQPSGSFFAGTNQRPAPQWAPQPPVQGTPNFYMAPGSSYGGPVSSGPAPGVQAQWDQGMANYAANQQAQANWDAWRAQPVETRPVQAPPPPPQRRFEPAPSDKTYGGTASTRMQ